MTPLGEASGSKTPNSQNLRSNLKKYFTNLQHSNNRYLEKARSKDSAEFQQIMKEHYQIKNKNVDGGPRGSKEITINFNKN